MPETNFLTPASPLAPENIIPEKIKKPRKKAIRKKKALKAAVSDNLTAGRVMPKFKAEAKIKDNLPVSKKNDPKKIYSKIAFSFIALTVILAAAAVYLGFSKVTLVLIPAQEKISDSLTLDVIDKGKNPALSQGQIAGLVREEAIEQSQTFLSNGKQILGQEVTGKVTLINNYVKNQPLVATTRLLSSDNKLFRLKNTVNAPAGGRVEAEVYADEARQDLAVGPGKFTIPGLWAGLQDKIYAESQEPMLYKEKVKYVINQDDIDNAVIRIKNNLLAKAKQKIGDTYKEYDQAVVTIDNNTISQEVLGKVGEEKENFKINIRAKALVVAFKSGDIYDQAKIKIEEMIADDKEIAEFNPSDLSFNLADINLSQGTAQIKVNFNSKVAIKDGADIIKKKNLAGLDAEELKNYLNSLPEIAGYEIKRFPSFIKKIPYLADRIEIVIKK